MTDYTQHAEAVHDDLPDDTEASIDAIEAKLSTQVEKYDMPLSEAKKAVRRMFAHQTSDGAADSEGFTDEDLSIGDLDTSYGEDWFNIEAEVLDLWDDLDDSIAQKGVLGDDSGTIIFTTFQQSVDKAGERLLVEEGETYRFESVVGNVYQDTLSLKVNRASTIKPLDASFSPQSPTVSFTAPLVAVQSRSGLIKRCTEDGCNRVIENGRCADHGQVEGRFALRIKAVFDDGHETTKAVFNTEATAAVTGITLEDAKAMADEHMDVGVVEDEMTRRIIGQYFTVEARDPGEFLIIESFEQVTPDVQSTATALLEEYTTDMEAQS